MQGKTAVGASDKPRVLIDEAALQARVRALAAEISADYAAYADSQAKPLVVVIVLKGSFVFGADLVRGIDLPLEVDFLGVRSYGDETTSSGVVQITSDLSRSIEDRDVLVVEDIVDTGLTLGFLLDNLRTRSPRSLKLAALLHKPAHTRRVVPLDYLGFTVEDVFVVGYGLDAAQRYRNLPYVGVLDVPAADASAP